MKKQKILIVQLGRIGDIILMTPVFDILKKANRDNIIHVLAGKHNSMVVNKHPHIDKVYAYQKNFIKLPILIWKLKHERYDIWIDPRDHHSSESIFFASQSNAGLKIGFNQDNKSVFDVGIKSDKEQMNAHAVTRNIECLSSLKIKLPASQPRPNLYVTYDSEKRLATFLKEQNITSYYCINISATSKTRYWQTDKWIKFLDYANEQKKNCILISAPNDSNILYFIKSKTGQNVNIYDTESIIDVFSIVKNSALTITPDTAVVHVASAFNVPVLAMYSNIVKNYTKFSPLSTHYRMVMNDRTGSHVPEISYDLFFSNYLELVKKTHGRK